MEPQEKTSQPWLKSKIEGEIKGSVDKIEYRRMRTCCCCKSELRNLSKTELIDKMIQLADPTFLNYKIMKEKLRDES